MAEDPLYPLHPPIRRTLAQAVERLKAQGHQVIPLSVHDCHTADATEVSWELFTLAPETTLGYINSSGEPMVPSVAKNCGPANAGQYKFVPDLSKLDRLHKMAALNVKRQEICDDWRKIWQEKHLDAVIGPSAQNTAVPHDTFGWPPYTVLLNVLDVSAGPNKHQEKCMD